MARWTSVLLLLMLTLAACRQPTVSDPIPESPAPSRESPGPVPESPLSPVTTPTPVPPERTSPLPNPDVSPVETPSGAAEQVLAAARTRLAEELGVDPSQVEIASVQSVQWSDTSLGCPEPGMAYAQVITPGYRIVLEVDGTAYEVHTDRTARAVVICAREQ